MTNRTIAKIGSSVLGLAMVLSFAAPAGAATVAELQAQINALMAQLAALQGGSTTATAGVSFTQNLTVGSTGSEVVALQQMLVAQGHLVMPAGVAFGYFGSLTKAAVAKWQAANGVSPALGYWGPISRARAAALGMGGGTTVGGTVGTGQTGVITTPGIEGTITATLSSTPTGVKLYEGDSRKAVMGIRLEAKRSDIRVERIKLDLNGDGVNSDTDFYRKIASRVYVMDGSTVLASADLNSDTVVKENSDYFITLTGVNYVVPKDATRVLTIALDARSTWDTAYDGDTWTITVPSEGVRGVDGAGINQYSGSAFSRNFTSEAEAIAAAALKLSLNANSPAAALVVAADGTDEDERDGVELLRFDAKAEKDAVTITDLSATITHGGSGTATTSTIYLMDGSTVIDSADGNVGTGGATVTFSDIDYVVPKDSTKTLRIVVDIKDANGTATTFSAAVTNSQVTDENSVGDSVVTSGSATGETITVLNVGPEISLASKSISKTEIGFAGATSSAKATFNVTLRAVGGDIYFGTQSASSTFAFQTYKGGVAETLTVASSTSWAIPSGVVTNGLATGQAFKLAEGQSVTIPVDFIFEGRTTAGALVATDAYAVGLENVKWSPTGNSTVTTNFMSGKTDWRTTTVTMP